MFPHSREWDSTGTIESIRTALDGLVLSYIINLTNWGPTVRHRKYLMRVLNENIPNSGNGVEVTRQGRDMAADRRVVRSRSGSDDDMPSGVTGPDTGVKQGRLGNTLANSTADGAVTGLGADQAGRSGRRHREPDLEQLAKLRPRRR